MTTKKNLAAVLAARIKKDKAEEACRLPGARDLAQLRQFIEAAGRDGIRDQVGYLFGRKVGPALFRRPESRLFKPEYVMKAELFFEKHGAKAIVLARSPERHVQRTLWPEFAIVAK